MSEEIKKTPEELLEEKKVAFAANPGAFVCLEDVVIGAIKTPSGNMICVGNVKRSEIELALTRINSRAYQMFMHMDMAMQEEAALKVLVPGNGKKHGVMDFVRWRIK